jgi:hypothetical protein
LEIDAGEMRVKKRFQGRFEFSFALKNPQNYPARQFALKAEEKPEQSIAIPPIVQIFMALQLNCRAWLFPAQNQRRRSTVVLVDAGHNCVDV